MENHFGLGIPPEEMEELAKLQAESNELSRYRDEMRYDMTAPLEAIDIDSERQKFVLEQIEKLSAAISDISQELASERAERIASEKASKKHNIISLVIAGLSLLFTTLIGIISLLK